MQLCSKPRGARGIGPETFEKKGSAFILSSDNWTTSTGPQACDNQGHSLCNKAMAFAEQCLPGQSSLRMPAFGPWLVNATASYCYVCLFFCTTGDALTE